MSASLEAQLRLDIAQYQAQLAKARGDAKKFRDQIASEGRGKGGVMQSLLGDVQGMLPAMGVAAAVGGFKQIISAADDLVDAGLRLNETTETLQRVEYASKLMASVDMEGLVGSFLKLEKALGDVENKAANDALARYGVSAEALARAPLDQKILMMAEAFQRSRADGHGYNDVLALLGKSAGNLIPMFEQTRETIEATFAEAAVIPDSTIQQMAALNDTLDGFLMRVQAGAGAVVGLGMNLSKMVGMVMSGETDAFAKAFSSPDADPAAGVQKKKDDQARAQAEARAKVEAEKAVAEAQKAQEKAKAELLAISRKQADLDARRFQDYLDILPPNLKLIELRRELLRLEQEKEGLVGPGLDEQRIAVESKILDVRRQTRQAEGEIADEKERATKEAEAAAKEQGRKDNALADLQAEMDIIREQAAGRKEKAEALQQELDIQREAKRIMDETGLSEQQAMELAKEHARLKEQLAKGEDTEGKIKGYKRADQGGAAEARQRAADRLTASRDRTDKAVTDAFGTLPQRDAEGNLQNPLSGMASRNAANETQRNNTVASTTGTAEQAAQIVISALPQILSTLTGA